MNPYRIPGERFQPVCPHCLTDKWRVVDDMWAEWVCQVCRNVWDYYDYDKLEKLSKDSVDP